MQRQFNRIETGEAEKHFSQRIVGLRSREEFSLAQQQLRDGGGVTAAASTTSERPSKTVKLGTVSFGGDDDDDEDEDEQQTTKGIRKDPSAPTVVPDAREIERLKQQWDEEQERAKKEPVEINFVFGNGGSMIKCKIDDITKGTTIGEFLDLARRHLAKMVPDELMAFATDSMIFVKDDVIIPAVYCFQDLVMCDAKAKSGTRLFEFNQGRPVRVCHRTWYEKNKTVYPLNRWEVFQPGDVQHKRA